MRPQSVAGYPGRLRVQSVVLGNFEVAAPASPLLDRDVDVLLVATKATQLEHALELAPPERVGEAVVVPLLNGVDHVELLRTHYRNVVGAAIRVESERTASGVIEQKSPFVRLDLAGAEEVQTALRDAGLDCRGRDDEPTLLWEKLVFLAPVALATTAFDSPLGAVREDPSFVACREEAATAARAAGATVDLDPIRAQHEAAPAAMQSSMQKDVAAGREPELAAIAGPIVRLGAEYGFPTAATVSLVERVRARSHEPVRNP
jgi:2-dehydropantoate 2-reductase